MIQHAAPRGSADPNAPCGASTAAPNFEARRFGARVCCSCWRFAKRQIEAMQFRGRYFWSFSAVCWPFLTFLTEVASTNGIRRLIFRSWESSLHKFVASSLQVLCISCKLLASSLQVLCKFLAKFLAKSLQEFSAGGGKRGKVRPKMAPKSI